MTRIAPFNPRRFTSAIPHYVAGRPPYSMRLVERLARETGLGEAARTLDLGCGPGSLTLPLARFSGTTIGIDPDAAMIAAAQEAAEVAAYRSSGASAPRSIFPTSLPPSTSSPSAAPSTGWTGRRHATVRQTMTALEPSGRFPEIVESTAMIARRAR